MISHKARHAKSPDSGLLAVVGSSLATLTHVLMAKLPLIQAGSFGVVFLQAGSGWQHAVLYRPTLKSETGWNHRLSKRHRIQASERISHKLWLETGFSARL